MIEPPPPFVCVVCEQTVDRRWWSKRDRMRSLPPICTSCEQWHTMGVGQPKFGSFMDRRNTMRISALASALAGKAGSIEWGAKYGRA